MTEPIPDATLRAMEHLAPHGECDPGEILALIAAYRESQAERVDAEDRAVREYHAARKAEAENERLREAVRIGTELDNHHNADACPYCIGGIRARAEKAEADLAQAEAQAAREANDAHEAGEALAALRAGIEAMSGDLWRVTPCGCGHRADLHTDAGCIAGLTFCGCRWTFTTVLQERLRSLLSTSTDRADGEA